MALRARRGGNGLDAWPGYVDALSTLLMVVMFALLVFVLAQAFESVLLAQRNEALSSANQSLTREREQNLSLRGSVSRLNQDLSAGDAARAALQAQIRDLNAQTARTMSERDRLAELLRQVEIAAAAAAAMNRTLTVRAEDSAKANTRLTADLAARGNEVAALNQRADASARANQQLTADLAARSGDLAAQTRRADAAARANQQLSADLAARTGDVAALNQRADAAAQANQQLTADLAARAADLARLRQDMAAAEARMRDMREQMAALDRTVKADKQTIDAKLSDLARLMEQIANLTALRDSLEAQTRAAAQRQTAAEAKLTDATRLGDSARARLALLEQQVEQLRSQLAVSERSRADEQSRNSGLTEQLNLALAAQVEELRKYRSDFFGKLRAVLAGQPGVTVVGDRFVFQSEVLFGVSSAELVPAGLAQMTDLATTVRRLMDEIPPDVNWVLRVDGHTDAVPVRNARFPSNWELSAARAITVVKFLITQGIPARHLAATGFGENQPVDPGETAEAYAKNRRIEIRLTDR